MKPPSHVTKPSKVIYHRPRPVPLAAKIAHAGGAAFAIAAQAVQGGPVLVPEEIEQERLAICETKCPGNYWRPEGNAGLGECTHPSCGCTSLKHKFAVMQCPHNPPAWEAWKP
jgi:hypothetical protein